VIKQNNKSGSQEIKSTTVTTLRDRPGWHSVMAVVAWRMAKQEEFEMISFYKHFAWDCQDTSGSWYTLLMGTGQLPALSQRTLMGAPNQGFASSSLASSPSQHHTRNWTWRTPQAFLLSGVSHQQSS
jgi:hypothetical protein